MPKPNGGTAAAGDDQTVAVIEKGSDEQVRATVNFYRGSRYVQLRTYWRSDGESWIPTKKGISVSADRLNELEDAVAALRRAVGPSRDSAA